MRIPARLRQLLRFGVYPTPRLAALVAVAGAAWLIPGTAGRVVAAVALSAVFVAALVDYARLPVADEIELRRSLSEHLGLGDDEMLRHEIESRAARSVRARLFDALPPGIRGDVHDEWLTLEARETHVRETRIVGDARGRYRLGPVAVRLETPLGLIARIVRVAREEETVVVPSLANVRRFRLLALQNRLSEAGIRAIRQRGDGSAFAGLRDYVPGDDPRLLDWKATARHARLITREQTVERSQTVIALVDCGRAMTQLAGAYSRLEHVLSAALVLSDVASSGGDRVGLIAFDHEVRSFVAPQKGGAAVRAVRVALSGLHATMTEPDYAAAFRLLALRQRRRALVVFFTDVIDARTARSFVAYAGRAAQRHMLLVVAIENEELAAAARPTVHGATALYRSAAAEELIREREEALARMRGAGITVIDVAAGQMAAAVVNRYLEIKARGLL